MASRVRSAQSTSVRARLGVGIATVTLAGGLVLAPLAGCAASSGAPVSTNGGDRVVVLTTGTVHEPRPMLTDRALAELRAAAGSTNTSDGPAGVGSIALVSTADGRFSPLLALTPRRANGAVEHGLQRNRLIEDNLRRVSDTVVAMTASRPGLDLLQGIDDAIAGSDHGVLVLVSNGLSTSGGFDLRQVGWNAEPDHIATQLRERDLLPDLAGWRVLFTGIGGTAGDQPPLPKPTRDTLTAYWTAICKAAAADSCEVDDTRFDRTAPVPGPQMPIVPIPEITSVTGPSGEVTTTISDRVLGFAGDSAALAPTALDLLRDTAARINVKLTDQPDAVITIRGYTADPPESTPRGRELLSRDRAQAVADALVTAGVTHRIVTIGAATAPELTAMVNGTFDEVIAAQMRRVEITY